MEPGSIPCDYDENPERFRLLSQAVQKYSLVGDVHELVAARIVEERLKPVLDIGCGDGRLTSLLQTRDIPFVGLDLSPTMLRHAPRPCVRGDATSLPFLSGTFGGVAALYMLYHLTNPMDAIAESHRVLRPGGLFAAATPSRDDNPELASVLPPQPHSTFDAETAPDIIREFFPHMEVEKWDGPFTRLPDHDAIVLYLVGERLQPEDAVRAARRLGAPLTLTKRGALIYGYKTK